jgi:hypothetical protein
VAMTLTYQKRTRMMKTSELEPGSARNMELSANLGHASGNATRSGSIAMAGSNKGSSTIPFFLQGSTHCI